VLCFYFDSFIFIFRFLILRNNIKWLDYEQFCAQSFRNDCTEHLDTTSLIEVYERLIHAAIQQKKSPPYLCYQTHIL